MGCCGGSAKRVAVTRAAAVEFDGVLLVYTGPRLRSFEIVGAVTRLRYYVPGPGEIVELAKTGKQGINKADMAWFLAVNRGKDYGPPPEELDPEPETEDGEEDDEPVVD